MNLPTPPDVESRKPDPPFVDVAIAMTTIAMAPPAFVAGFVAMSALIAGAATITPPLATVVYLATER